MEEKMIKLTLAAQIAGQVVRELGVGDIDKIVDNTVEIINRLYERI